MQYDTSSAVALLPSRLCLLPSLILLVRIDGCDVQTTKRTQHKTHQHELQGVVSFDLNPFLISQRAQSLALVPLLLWLTVSVCPFSTLLLLLLLLLLLGLPLFLFCLLQARLLLLLLMLLLLLLLLLLLF